LPNPPPAAAGPFDYALVPAADRDWLVEQTGTVHRLCRQTAEGLLRAGAVLAAVRRRLPRRQFKAWLRDRTPFSRSNAYRLMAAAAEFDLSQIGTLDPSALYLLAEPSCPPEARALALQYARAGTRVTHALAREVVAACRPGPAPTAADLRAVGAARRAAGLDDAPPPPPAAGADGADAWRALVELRRGGARVRIEGAEGEEGGVEVTVWRPGRPPAGGRGDTTAAALLAAAGRGPAKVCKKCDPAGRSPLPLAAFPRDANQPDGRRRYCKRCEAARLRRYKRKPPAA
jgi:hypothetical protein